MRFGALVSCLGLGLAAANGCSAGGLSIEPVTVTATGNDITESEFLALGMVVRDAVALVIPQLLGAQAGPFIPQSKTRGKGILGITGTVELPAPKAATFAMAVDIGEYQPPKFSSVQKYSDWKFSNGPAGPLPMTLSFVDMPSMPLDFLGTITGTFDGPITVVDGKLPGDLDVRLSLNGQLVDDVDGKVFFQLLHISGVITSAYFGSYTNDVPFEPAGTTGGGGGGP